MKYAINVPAETVTVKFSDTSIEVIKVSDISTVMQRLVLLYGLKQKVTDAAASALKLSAANGTDVETQREKMARNMIERIMDGTAFDRASGDGTGRVSYFAEAVAFLYNITLEVATAKIKAMDEEKQKQLAANPKVVAKIASLKAEAAIRAAERAAIGGDDDEEELPEL